MNEVRIIGGQFKGRKIRFRPTGGLRPTLDAVRETLFNWLMFKVKDAKCLDLFAGSGALGFEALSRFASLVVFVEQDREALLSLKKNIALFEAQEQGKAVQDTAFHFLSKNQTKFDLIFLDPPFKTPLLAETLSLIHEKAALAREGLIYFEAERQLDITPFIERKFSLYRHKTLGEVQFGLLTEIVLGF